MHSLLIWLGFPVWILLLVAGIAVIGALYVSLWAVFVAVAASALSVLVAGVFYVIDGNMASGLAMISAALVGAGLSIFLFFGCREATKGISKLTKRGASGIKRLFVRKGDAA